MWGCRVHWFIRAWLGKSPSGASAPHPSVPSPAGPGLCLSGVPPMEPGLPHARAVEMLWVWAEPTSQLLPEGHTSGSHQADHQEALQPPAVCQLQGEQTICVFSEMGNPCSFMHLGLELLIHSYHLCLDLPGGQQYRVCRGCVWHSFPVGELLAEDLGAYLYSQTKFHGSSKGIIYMHSTFVYNYTVWFVNQQYLFTFFFLC